MRWKKALYGRTMDGRSHEDCHNASVDGQVELESHDYNMRNKDRIFLYLQYPE